MYNYKTDIYLLKTLTNLHAGSGDSDYGIVDKQVQRDSITTLPVIHASSVKGALRELFAYEYGKGDTDKGHQHTTVVKIFGSDTKRDASKKLQTGEYRFLEARLLALPARSNVKPYFMATSPEVLRAFVNDLELFNSDKKILYKTTIDDFLKNVSVSKGRPLAFGCEGEVLIDEYEAISKKEILPTLDNIKTLLGTDAIALFNHDDFKSLCERLPVIARNHLEDGISTNLWYEEVVPRASLFYCCVNRPEANNQLELTLTQLNHLAQIGGNATIGYGLVEMTLIPSLQIQTA